MDKKLSDALECWLAHPGQKLLAFDYDGTLAAVPPIPSLTVLTKETRDSLLRLSESESYCLAVISGRSVENLRHLLPMHEKMVLSGNHGYEISGCGLHFTHPDAIRYKLLMLECTQELQLKLSGIPGVCWEVKNLSSALFFKGLDDCYRAEVTGTAEAVIGKYAGLTYLKNEFVYEICPKINWHKGLAAAWIADAFNIPHDRILFVGDEINDEAAFEYLTDSLTVKVGVGVTAAKYRLSAQEKMQDILKGIPTN